MVSRLEIRFLLFRLVPCILALLILCPRAVVAYQDEVVDERPAVIMLASRQDEATFHRVAEAMLAQFSGSGARFDVHWVDALPPRMPDQEQMAAQISADTGALAILWCDLEAAERVYFYLATAHGKRVLVRRLDGTGEEGLADALALISRSAVDAILQGGVIDIVPPVPSGEGSRKENSPPQPSPPGNGSRKPGVLVFADAAYSMHVVSPKSGILNGAYISLSSLLAQRVHVFAGYTFLQKLEESNDFAKLVLARHPIHLGLGARFFVGNWSFEGDAILALDYMTRAPSVLGESTRVREPYGKIGPSIEPALRAEVHLLGALSLFLRVGIEIHFVKQEWTLTNGPDFFDDLWRVQPHVLIGGRFDLF